MSRYPCERVLVVDDDYDTLLTIREVLETVGVRVEVAQPADALATAARVHPDVILLDVGFHEAHGMELVRALGDDPGTATVPLVLMSTTDSVLTKLSPSADATMTKPFSIDSLLDTLSSFCREAVA